MCDVEAPSVDASEGLAWGDRRFQGLHQHGRPRQVVVQGEHQEVDRDLFGHEHRAAAESVERAS